MIEVAIVERERSHTLNTAVVQLLDIITQALPIVVL